MNVQQNSPDGAEKKINFGYSETREGTELQKSKEIKNTPFVMKWIDETGYFAVCGKYRITEVKETEEEIINYIAEKPWSLIITLMGIIAQESQNMKIMEIEESKNMEKMELEN